MDDFTDAGAAGGQRLCTALLAKIDEQIERAQHLIKLVPPGGEEWRPAETGNWPLGVLLGHLLESLAGFCAVLTAMEPERLAHLADLRLEPVNHFCFCSEAADRIPVYQARIAEGFALLNDARLGTPVPTIFVADGEPVLTLLLGNLEHLINHKHQLFTYLKQMGVAVSTRDLYRLRGT